MSHMDTSTSGGSPFGSAPDRAKSVLSNVGKDASKAFGAVRAQSVRVGRAVETQWPTVRERVPVRAVVIAVIVAAIVAMLVVGISRLIGSSGNTDAVQSSPSIEIKNLSNGREGRPFVLAGGRPLFPLPATALDTFADKPVEMQDVAVTEYVQGVGFWVGIPDNQADQVFVEMRPVRGDGREALTLTVLSVGDKVNLSGYMKELQLNPESMGITDPNRAGQLDHQAYLVEANSVRPQAQR